MTKERVAARPAATFVMMVLVLAIGLLALCTRPAAPHDSWISQGRLTDPISGEWCCNEHDCRAETVREVVGGYATQAGDVVPYARVLWRSPDGLWWRCRKYVDGRDVTRCLIGPPPGF